MSSAIELQPIEMRKLRNYIRSTVTKSLKAIRQHNPNIKFDKTNGYREYFIGETFKRYLVPISITNETNCKSIIILIFSF